MDEQVMNGSAVIASTRLMAPAGSLGALRRFYVDCLGFAGSVTSDRELSLTARGAGLTFVAAGGSARPFYHFALLVPGDRFAAARSWASRCAELLRRPGESSTTFRFGAWDADACYLHDPAGNIVELIAHRGVAEAGGEGSAFSAAEIAGISEVGLVVADPPDAARTLAAAGIALWSGTAEGEDALAFVGRRAHTLILCRPGRPWLPTRRPAEPHPVTVAVGSPPVTVVVREGRLSIR